MSITLNDRLNGSHLGSSILGVLSYGDGCEGQAIYFGYNNNFIRYDGALFPNQGTVTFYIKPTLLGSVRTILTSNYIETHNNTFSLQINADGSLSWYMRAADGLHTATSTTRMEVGRWYRVSVGYGPTYGLKLWINGNDESFYNALGNHKSARYAGQLVYLGDKYTSAYVCFRGYVDWLRVSDVEADPVLVSNNAAIRVHSYSLDPHYDFDFLYERNGAWHSLKSRVLTKEPLVVSKQYREFYTGSLTLDNVDGLLSADNAASEYNQNNGDYDPLLDEARKVRLIQGVWCYPDVSFGLTCTASTAPTSGSLVLNDGLLGDVNNSSDSAWTKWQSVAPGGTITLTYQLPNATNIRHCYVSLLSKSADGIKLPTVARFEYANNAGGPWYQMDADFDTSPYAVTVQGKRCLVWFRDIDRVATHVRVTLVNGHSTSINVAVDEYTVYGGNVPLFLGKPTVTGYLGESINWDNKTGSVTVEWLDVRKKESDNRLIELTAEYKDKRPEEIIYDLLTNPAYWTGFGSDYDAPVSSSEIGWAASDNLSSFPIPKWQGQQGTILDYIGQMEGCIGWVYDVDGDGKRQFYEPQRHAVASDSYMDFFGDRWGMRSTPKRVKAGTDIRNCVKIVGSEGGMNRQVPYTFTHQGSIDRYGKRYARITDPVIKTPEMARQLGQALLREFAFPKDQIVVATYGEFDIERPSKILTFNEPIRAHLAGNLWCLDSFNSEMIAVGRGKMNCYLDLHDYIANPPSAVSGVRGFEDYTTLNVFWDGNIEPDVQGYYVYHASGDDPEAWTFTKSPLVTTKTSGFWRYDITGLTGGAPYWVYVTAVNADGVESDKSGIARLVPGALRSWSAADTFIDPNVGYIAVSYKKDAQSVVARLDPGNIWSNNATEAIVCVMGPSTDNPPTTIKETVVWTPNASGLGFKSIYVSMKRSEYSAGTTLYWRLALYQVTINGINYHFGQPALTPVDSAQWPS